MTFKSANCNGYLFKAAYTVPNKKTATQLRFHTHSPCGVNISPADAAAQKQMVLKVVDVDLGHK